MKLNRIQWLWMIAAAALMLSLILDLADVLDVPTFYILVGNMLLLVSGWWVIPSMREIDKAQRRRY
ncbi:MAG TPA: hypothetical protein VF688_11080 [Allosphingosinicella sp.]|jgi:hypothetical protein